MARDEHKTGRQKPVVIKKYANRRLYNTATSSYVTLDHLCQMVKDDVDFVVYDAKTGEDITRSVLTQIIVEEESKGTNLLPIAFLRQLISFYGHSMQGIVPRYLEHMMGVFAQNQDRLRQQMQETMSGMFPFGTSFEEMSRQNAALMESAMKMFNPFGGAGGESGPNASAENAQSGSVAATTQAPASSGDSPEALAKLQQQVDHLQKQLNALSAEQAAAPASTGETGGTERSDDGGSENPPRKSAAGPS